VGLELAMADAVLVGINEATMIRVKKEIVVGLGSH
jgi:hypothetical protein